MERVGFKVVLTLCGAIVLTACGLTFPKGAYEPKPFTAQYQRLSRSLAQAAIAVGEQPDRYKFGFIRSWEVNAANAGAGTFYFTDGLAAQPQEVIDGVVAHEVAHEVLGHVGRQIATSFAVSTLFAVGGAFVPGLQYADYAVNPLVTRAFGRTQELDADRKAIEILRKMGHTEPERVMLGVLSQLKDRYGAAGGGLLATHPNIDERIAEIAKLRPGVTALAARTEFRLEMLEDSAKRYEFARSLLAAGEIQKREQAIVYVEGIVRENPLFRDVLTLLARGYYDQGRYRDAVEILKRALVVNKEDEIAWLVLGLSQLRLEENERGLESLKGSLVLLARKSQSGYRGFSDWDFEGLVKQAIQRAVLQVARAGLAEKERTIESCELLLRSLDAEELAQKGKGHP